MMERSPKVSIIIPVYNAESYIKSTIDSCLGQSYDNIEIILVNDGSSDNSEAIIFSFKDERIRYIKTENRGATYARNTGIERATGKLLQFLDSDDILDRNKIEQQVVSYKEWGEEYIYTATMGVMINNERLEDSGLALYNKDFTPVHYFDLLLSSFGKYLTTGVWLIPKAIIDKTYGWDPNASFNDDGEYMMRLIIRSKGLKYCPKSLFYYRRDVAGSLSKQRSSKQVYETWLYSYISYKENFLQFFPGDKGKDLAWKALSTYYCESYPHFPALLAKCKAEIKKMGYKKIYPKGGGTFVKVAKWLGIDIALKVWNLKQKL